MGAYASFWLNFKGFGKNDGKNPDKTDAKDLDQTVESGEVGKDN